MLRALLLLLVAANLVYLSWWRGWLPADLLPLPLGEAGQREPGRLEAQLRPDSIEVVGSQQAAELAALACVQAGPFDDADWPVAEAAIERAGLQPGSWRRVPAETPASGAWLRVPEANADQQARLQDGAAFTPCP